MLPFLFKLLFILLRENNCNSPRRPGGRLLPHKTSTIGKKKQNEQNEQEQKRQEAVWNRRKYVSVPGRNDGDVSINLWYAYRIARATNEYQIATQLKKHRSEHTYTMKHK